ncbi:hypothetical protein AVEN_31511-1 [Araneus ventricosus]|uniref:Uncharacterized protein n=2 Tax=Araneus ventricosus TaxID=182803 RepID=A0A4Y1ZM67_ARAVE|nr:hypothetical protein AVEN_244925-1 [Araneus ventricosus]GBL57220.1 hypothetical protein AVEN_31511-1 [Araneus ventricosus]
MSIVMPFVELSHPSPNHYSGVATVGEHLLPKKQPSARFQVSSPNGLRDFVMRNPSIGQYLSVHKDSFSYPPSNRRLEEAVVVEWSLILKRRLLILLLPPDLRKLVV